jgi:hypothetical protein
VLNIVFEHLWVRIYVVTVGLLFLAMVWDRLWHPPQPPRKIVRRRAGHATVARLPRALTNRNSAQPHICGGRPPARVRGARWS